MVKLPIPPQRMAVLVGAANGKSNEEMARAMNVSLGTIKCHMAALFDHLGIQNRAHAVGLALRLKIIAPEQIVQDGECPGVRTIPNWCRCDCSYCTSHRCDQHGSVADLVKRLGLNPSHACYTRRHRVCTSGDCTCECHKEKTP